MLMTKTNQWILEHGQPVHGHPLGRAGLPEAETDTHGAGKQQDDVPGNLFQVIDIQQAGGEKENR
jgi:hypothetical protein